MHCTHGKTWNANSLSGEVPVETKHFKHKLEKRSNSKIIFMIPHDKLGAKPHHSRHVLLFPVVAHFFRTNFSISSRSPSPPQQIQCFESEPISSACRCPLLRGRAAENHEAHLLRGGQRLQVRTEPLACRPNFLQARSRPNFLPGSSVVLGAQLPRHYTSRPKFLEFLFLLGYWHLTVAKRFHSPHICTSWNL